MGNGKKPRNPKRDARSPSEPTQLDRIEGILHELKKDVADLKTALVDAPATRPGPGRLLATGNGGEKEGEPDPP